ncbi:hypothetical protein H2200_010438 [Cladophialophora chaetospira]|uniref:Heterokaryon incompatibility domain-containing protein n=1 Tax=Cladophialophora chaetospira TaxID=386627 RepID=A0AA39CE79_9EURO|nr:hypothetical protein H2200_010438 [Cladophialophora chaetospira]
MSTPDSESDDVLKQLQRSLTLTEQAVANSRERRLSLPTSVSATPLKPLPVIRLAYFDECSCSDFGDKDSHLSITTKKSELHKSHGVAISYTWGDFDRERRVIGHWSNPSKEAVTIVLGAEWRVSSFKRRLVQLTTRYGACWIDQLCMPQKEEKIRKTLAEVPNIYKILPVVVLLPGSLCKCLREAVKLYRAVEVGVTELTETKSTLDRAYVYLSQCLSGELCLNSGGSCSWPSRLWPLQELLNSTSLSVLYINEDTASCFELWPDAKAKMRHLNDYLYEACAKAIIERGLDRSGATEVLKMVNFDFHRGLLAQQALLGDKNQSSQFMSIRAASLLLGEVVRTNDRPVPGDGGFLFRTLEKLAQSTGRTTTKEVDYVVATCTSWQGYSIPRNYSKLTARHLLEDALHQYHCQHEDMVPSRSPSGLLGGTSNSAFWDSSSSREGIDIRDSTDVFGVLAWEYRLSAPNPQRLPIKLLPGSPGSLGRYAQYFDEWEHGQSVVTTINRLLEIVPCWDYLVRYRGTLTRNRHLNSEVRTLLLSPSPAVQVKGLSWLLSTVLTFDNFDPAPYLAQLREILLRLPFQMLEDALYDCACDLIRVKSNRFREKQVKLVFSKWHGQRCDQPSYWKESSGICMGFVNGPLFETARSAGASFLTLAGSKIDTKIPFYELVRRPSQPNATPEYTVIGIWLPLVSYKVKMNEIGGVLIDGYDEHDAVLV